MLTSKICRAHASIVLSGDTQAGKDAYLDVTVVASLAGLRAGVIGIDNPRAFVFA